MRIEAGHAFRPGPAAWAPLLAAAVLAGCAAGGAALPPIESELASPALQSEEAQLWAQSRAFEQRLADAHLIRDDPALDAYLAAVLERLIGDSLAAAPVRPVVRVLEHPASNALAFPHGTILVYAGLLATLREEPQLAAVLAHELAHFRCRHGLQEARVARRHRIFGAILGGSLAIAALGATGVPLPELIEVGDTYALLATLRYSRVQEREADGEALGLLFAAGYPLDSLPQALQLLQQEEESDPDPRFSWLRSHPATRDRIASVIDSIASYAGDPPVQRAPPGAYAEAVVDALVANAERDLVLRRFDRVRGTMARALRVRPGLARALFLLAECDRLEFPDGPDFELQIAAYREAIAADPSYAPPYAELGLLYRRIGRTQEALDAFRDYVARSPETPNAGILRGYARRMSAGDEAPAAEPGPQPPEPIEDGPPPDIRAPQQLPSRRDPPGEDPREDEQDGAP